MALKFDLSPVSSLKVTKAVLSVYASEKFGNLRNGPKSLYRFTGDWKNKQITWSNAPRYASTASAKSNNSSFQTWETYDVTKEIKDILSGSKQNYGFALVLNSKTYGVVYESSETGNISLRPKLTLTCEDTEKPTVSIINPSEGQSFKLGSSCKIAWEANDLFGVVSRTIYFTSGDNKWDKVDEGTATNGTGIFTFKFPNVVSDKCKIKVHVFDAANNEGMKESGTFAIVDPSSILPKMWHTSGLFVNPGLQNTVTVTNAQGKVIASFTCTSNAELQKVHSLLTPGINIITISNPINQSLVKKLISVK